MNTYEAIRLRNIEDNKRVLASFGLRDPSLPFIVKKGVRKEIVRKERPKKRSLPQEDFVGGSVYGTRRKSARIQGKEVSDNAAYIPPAENDDDEKPVYRVPPNRPNFYGLVPGIAVGTIWDTRMECCRDGVHRPTVAGIHGGEDGAYSIALSGGYEDDIDLGDCFTYTGEGGRDLKGTKCNPKNLRTAPQSKDQTLTRGNLALSKNVESGNPVRVIRGYKLKSPFAPDDGYRYDGLYSVEKCWFTTGLSGFGVWKFALKRLSDQEIPPWNLISASSTDASDTKDENLDDSSSEIPNEKRNEALSEVQNKKLDEATSEIKNEKLDEATSEIKNEKLDEATSEFQNEKMDEATSEIKNEKLDEATSEIQNEKLDEATSEIQNEKKDEATSEIQNEKMDEATSEIQNEKKDEATSEIQNEKMDEVTSEIQNEKMDEVTSEIQNEKLGEALSEIRNEKLDEALSEINNEKQDGSAADLKKDTSDSSQSGSEDNISEDNFGSQSSNASERVRLED